MHNLLAQLGKEIVRKQSPREPGKRQFLVNAKDICEVLNDYEAITRSVIGIDFSYNKIKDELNITSRGFEGMSNLQFFRFRGHLDPSNISLNYISPKLQLLDWVFSPMTCLDFIVNPEFLVELIMRNSELKMLWKGMKSLRNLKWMDLSYSANLKELTNLSTATSLEKLILSECSSLVELPSSIENATNLKYLNLKSCSSLAKLPNSIGNVTNLQKIDLCGCSSLVELPSSIGNTTNLQDLYLRSCSSLLELPSSIGNATNLKNLDLSYCLNLAELPSTIGNATNLKRLCLNYCLSLVELPYSIGNATNLQNLDLTKCSNLVELPTSIGNATNLQKLHLNGCSSLVKLPSSIGNATNLQEIDLSGCSSLVELSYSIGNATNLQNLNLGHCSNLVELPSSIGNLNKLLELNLKGCLKVEVLPTNINMESLITLDLTDCSLLQKFPEISRNIINLYLMGTSIDEVPSSIRSWSRLEELYMSYSENLKDLPHALDCITQLQLINTEIQDFGPWVKGFSRLRRLVLNEMVNLVSLPQLPDSLLFLDAESCESLERLDCSFRNPDICLNFQNCFNLNQEARDLIIQTSTREFVILPGGEVPVYFSFRAYGNSITVKLNEKHPRTSTKFRACILLVNMGVWDGRSVYCSIKSEHNDLTALRSNKHFPGPIFSEHLYIFDFEVEEVTSSELVFKFKLTDSHNETINDTWEIKECGILQLLELLVDENYESFRGGDKDSDSPGEKLCEKRSSALTLRKSKRRRLG